jgi:hypothetical protein
MVAITRYSDYRYGCWSSALPLGLHHQTGATWPVSSSHKSQHGRVRGPVQQIGHYGIPQCPYFPAVIVNILIIELSLTPCFIPLLLFTSLLFTSMQVNGQFQCMGTLQHLKSRFGKGLTIQARGQPNTSTAPLVAWIRSKFNNVLLKSEHAVRAEFIISSPLVFFASVAIPAHEPPYPGYSLHKSIDLDSLIYFLTFSFVGYGAIRVV